MLRLALLLICFALPLHANEQVVLGLSQNRVAITANFDGSEILVFGAVKREDPIPDGAPLEVVVAVSGPSEPITVRRKAKRFGIWVNTESVTIDSAPSFYAVATTGPLSEVLSAEADTTHRISVGKAITSVNAQETHENGADFATAVARIRTDNGLYALHENTVELDQETLFRTSISMPANLTEGDYQTRVFLTRGGEVISSYKTQIAVRKVGLERFLFNLSRQQPLVYGLLSLAIAVIAGWGASAFFRYVRQGA